MRYSIHFAALALVSAVTTAAFAAPPHLPNYHTAGTIPGPDGRWDFATWDPEHRAVLVAHGADVLVIDPVRSTVRAIGHIEGAHAAVPIPGTGHILVTSGRDDSIRILDLASGREIARIPAAGDPDAAILSADGRHAYVMGAKAGAISVIDLEHNTETARIALQPGLEVPVLIDRTTLAVNDEERSEIEIVDLASAKQSGTIALPGCEGPTGLAIDPVSHLALSSCANGQAALVDLAQRQFISLVAIGAGPDTVIWDRRHQRFIVPCGRSGTISVVNLVNRRAVPTSPFATEASARTAALDPASGQIYLPAARFGPAAPGTRPAPLAGTFPVLVLAPGRYG
jgi:DNA-binding beta-propeller fold protein YncE